MRRKLVPMMVAVLALGLLAGCGGGDEPASDAPAQQQEATPGAESTPEAATPEATPEGETEANGNSTDAQVEDAIQRCKDTVQSQPQVSAETRADLEKTCEAAASGDPEAVRDAAAEVCKKMIEESVPDGPARDAALETCKTAGR